MYENLSYVLSLEEFKRVIDKTKDWILHSVHDYTFTMSSNTLGLYETTYAIDDQSQLEEVCKYLYQTQVFIRGDEEKLSYSYARYLFPYTAYEQDIERASVQAELDPYTVLFVPAPEDMYYNRVWLIENPEFNFTEFCDLGIEKLRQDLLNWTQWLSTARLSTDAQIMRKPSYELTSSGKYRLTFNLSADYEDFAIFYIRMEDGNGFRRIHCPNYKDYILNAIDLIPEMSQYLGTDVTRLILPDYIPKPKPE